MTVYMRLNEFQSTATRWARATFGDAPVADKQERAYRFFEEAVELAQACGMSAADCVRMVELMYSRPVGEINREVGGVANTLAILCSALGVSMGAAAEDEMERCWRNIEQIRAKGFAKAIRSATLPESGTTSYVGTDR